MLVRYQGYEPMFRFNPEWTGVIPNVAERYEVNEDATEYTIYLREGLRWSDGHPFTTADVQFWHQDVQLDEDGPARQYLLEALALFQRLRDQLGEAHCLRSLGNVHKLLGEEDPARQRFQDALALYRSTGGKVGESHCLRRLGDLDRLRGEFDLARQRLAEALALAKGTGDQLGEAICLRSVGRVHVALGEYEPARQAYSRSLQFREALRAELEKWDRSASDFHEYEKERAPLLERIAVERARLAQEMEGLVEQGNVILEQTSVVNGLEAEIEKVQGLLAGAQDLGLPHNKARKLFVNEMLWELARAQDAWLEQSGREVEEAAFVDGASHVTVFRRIILPISMPALTTLGILTYILAWNEYLWPLLVGQNESVRVLTVALGIFQAQTPQGSPDWAGLMAATFVSALPVMLLFAFFGRKIVDSIQFSGIK